MKVKRKKTCKKQKEYPDDGGGQTLHGCISGAQNRWRQGASYFVRVRGESMIGLGLFDGDICLADRSEEITDGNIVVAFVNGGLTVKQIDLSTRDQGYLRLMPANPDFKPIIIDANDQFILQGKITSIHRDTRKY